MRKTLLVIQSYAGANEKVKWLWPFYKKAGCDILGVGRINAKCEWPEPVRTVDIGIDPQKPWVEHQSDNLVRRFLDTFEYCYTEGSLGWYTDFCVIEWDSIFLKPIPDFTGGLVSNCVGGNIAGFKASMMFHCPWWADRATAMGIVKYGRMLLASGECEMGTPDFFLGLIVDRFHIPWTQSHTFSVNTISCPLYVEYARTAIRSGVWHIHGVKEQRYLKAILPEYQYESYRKPGSPRVKKRRR